MKQKTEVLENLKSKREFELQFNQIAASYNPYIMLPSENTKKV